VQGCDAPADLQGKAPQQTEGDAAHQAAEQKRPPCRTQPVLEPVPRQLELKMMRPIAQEPGSDAVGHEVDRHHRERIDQVATRDSDSDIQAPPQADQNDGRKMDWQRNEAHRYTDAERRRDRVAVQRPQMRIGESVTENAQVPLVAARV
jgi:hypothetical protein